MAPGLAKLKPLVDALAPARRELGLDDLRRQPAANDNFELDPLDLVDVMVTLGEAAPAALFLFPMWAAASSYLKDPQYYLNKPKPQCGDDAQSQKKGRPLEWAPIRRFAPTHHDYRNPQLSDADRKKLLEWVAPTTHRGHFTGAEGLPKGLPHDPARDDSFGAPIDPRNMVMDRPLGDALPPTERALPDLQQDDVQRRLMMGDAIPGRERGIGDFAGATPGEKNARDFLPATFSGHVVDIRMQKGGSTLEKSPTSPFAIAMLEYTYLKRHVALKLYEVLCAMTEKLEATPDAEALLERVTDDEATIKHHDSTLGQGIGEGDWIAEAIGALGLTALRQLDHLGYSGSFILQWRWALLNGPDSREYNMGLVEPSHEVPGVRQSVLDVLESLAEVMGWHPELGRHPLKPMPALWSGWRSPSLDAVHSDYKARMAEGERSNSMAGQTAKSKSKTEKSPSKKKFVPGKSSGNGDKKIKFGRAAAKRGKKSDVVLGHYLSHPFAPDPFATDPARAIGFSKAVPGPIFRMSDGPVAMPRGAGARERTPRGPSYLGAFRQRIQEPNGGNGAGTPSTEVRPEATTAVEAVPPPNSAVSGEPVAKPKSPPIEVPLPRPRTLAEAEAVFRYLLETHCPVDQKGAVNSVRLRGNSRYYLVPLQFSDGSTYTTEGLMVFHERLYPVRSPSGRWQGLQGAAGSEQRLVDVFRRVASRPELLTRNQGRVARTIIQLPKVRVSVKSGVEAQQDFLRQVWAWMDHHHLALDTGSMETLMAEVEGGQRVRVRDVFEAYWRRLRSELIQKEVIAPDISPDPRMTIALELVHFRVLGRIRWSPRWGQHIQAIPLPLGPKEPLPDDKTIEGTLQVLRLVQRSSAMSPQTSFPTVENAPYVFYHPGSGQIVNYVMLLRRAHLQLAQVKADPSQAKRVETIPMDHRYMQDPDAAGKCTPTQETRQGLWDFVRRTDGRLRATVHRIPSGARQRQVHVPGPNPSGHRERIFDPHHP